MVSFIVPAYNVEQTIKKCLDSLLEQEDTNIKYEILVVNDGSTDNTRDVVLSYNTTKIRFFEKENGGLSDARNYGLERAQGDYIVFVDSDDYVSKTLLHDVEQYIDAGIDLIKWNPIWTYEDKTDNRKQPIGETFENITGEDGFNRLWYKDPLLDCAWNYCMKKEIVCKYPVGKYHEDFATTIYMMMKAKTFTSTDLYEYYYYQSNSSIMRGNDTEKVHKRLVDVLEHFDNYKENIKSLDIKEETKENIMIYATNALLVRVNELDKENKKYFVDELKRRKIYKYIKARNAKQLVKKMMLFFKY